MGEDQALYLHTTNLLYWQVFIISSSTTRTEAVRVVDPGLRVDTLYTDLSEAENPINLEFVSIVQKIYKIKYKALVPAYALCTLLKGNDEKKKKITKYFLFLFHDNWTNVHKNLPGQEDGLYRTDQAIVAQ